MTLVTVVYSRVWYHDLNYNILQLREDILVKFARRPWNLSANTHQKETPRFPAIAILQELWSSSQANLTGLKSPKCWIGQYNESAPPCESATVEQYTSLSSCHCTESVAADLSGSFTWGNNPYKYFLLTPPPNFISKAPGYPLTFQASFDCKNPLTLAV